MRAAHTSFAKRERKPRAALPHCSRRMMLHRSDAFPRRSNTRCCAAANLQPFVKIQSSGFSENSPHEHCRSAAIPPQFVPFLSSSRTRQVENFRAAIRQNRVCRLRAVSGPLRAKANFHESAKPALSRTIPCAFPHNDSGLTIGCSQAIYKGPDHNGPAGALPGPYPKGTEPMTKLAFTVAPVEFLAQGVAGFADPADFHPNALEAVMIYGTRRFVQDRINGQASAFRKAQVAGEVPADQTYDAAAAVAAILESLKTGTLSAPRGPAGPSFTAEQEATYAAAATLRAVIPAIAKAWKACKGMDSDERKTAILAAVDAMPKDDRAPIDAIAAAQLSAFASLAKTVKA